MTPEQLKQARSVLNMSQTELGLELGLTQKTISNMEAGRCAIRKQTLLAIKYLIEIDRMGVL